MKALVLTLGFAFSFAALADVFKMDCSNSDGTIVFYNYNGHNGLSVKTDKTEVLTNLSQVSMEFAHEQTIKETIEEFYPYTQTKVFSAQVTFKAYEGFVDIFRATHDSDSVVTEMVCTTTLTRILP